ncbi:MAG: metal-dependent hydrolase [Pirellulaceae bacterium]
MAGFKTHITTSTVLGVGYGAAGALVFGMPIQSSILAGGLCSVSGMLPDIDSDTGTPLRESIAFASAVVPMLLLNRFRQLGLDHETIVLCAAAIYVAIRFGAAEIIKRYTVHRGMWHSIPACAIAGLLAYLLCSGSTEDIRIFKAFGVVLGFMSHLLLDELYSIEWHTGRIRLKRSFGTAIKFWSKSSWANFSTYGKLAAVCLLLFGDPFMNAYLERYQNPPMVNEDGIEGEQPTAPVQPQDPLKTANDWLRGVLGGDQPARR